MRGAFKGGIARWTNKGDLFPSEVTVFFTLSTERTDRTHEHRVRTEYMQGRAGGLCLVDLCFQLCRTFLTIHEPLTITAFKAGLVVTVMYGLFNKTFIC